MSASEKPCHRFTMFKIPKPENRELALSQYRTLQVDALKDGKPYILNLVAGQALTDDQRAQGFTVAIHSTFASLADMQYYDDECKAHERLKGVVRPLAEGMMTIYFESIFD